MVVLVSSEVPIIDVSALLDTTLETQEIYQSKTAALIREALSQNGIFVMTGHEISGNLAEQVLTEAKSLFSVPLEAKMNLKLKSSESMRGYIPFGSESGLKNSNFEPKEGWAYGKGGDVVEEETNYLSATNLWPAQVREGLFESLYDKSVIYCEAIMHALFEDGIEHMMDGGEKISLMRIFHYFVAEVDSNDSSSGGGAKKVENLGSSPHRDWGMLTLILQDAPGLEFYDGDKWIAVPYIENSLVVNAGDFLNMISPQSSPYISPIHRVLSPTERKRLSFVFFYYPRYDTIIPIQGAEVTAEIDSEGEGEGNGKVTTNLEFNSLTSIVGLTSQPLRFGDAMITKWIGVQT